MGLPFVRERLSCATSAGQNSPPKQPRLNLPGALYRLSQRDYLKDLNVLVEFKREQIRAQQLGRQAVRLGRNHMKDSI